MNDFKKITNLKPARIDRIISNLGYCSRKEANVIQQFKKKKKKREKRRMR